MADKTLIRLNAHRDWANEKIIAWYLSLAEGDEYCLKMLSHILISEEVWLGRLLDDGPRRITWADRVSPREMQSLRVSHQAAWDAILSGDTARVFHYKRLDGTASQSTIADAFTHMCLHDQYHRGQIAAQAARLGLHVPSTDYILFARLD